MSRPGLPRNALVALGTLVYAKALIGACDYLVSRKILIPSISRKIVHVGAACWMLFWPLFDAETDGSWRLNVLIPASFAAQLFVKGAVLRNPDDEDVRSMSRTGDPTELLYGPLQFTVVMTALGLGGFMGGESCLVMAALGFGDGIAPVAGRLFGRRWYRTLGGAVKSVEGSLGMLGGTIVGYYVFASALRAPALPFPSVLLAGLVASVLEGCSPPNVDNITVSAAMYCLYPLLQ